MQHLEISGEVRRFFKSLGFKRLNSTRCAKPSSIVPCNIIMDLNQSNSIGMVKVKLTVEQSRKSQRGSIGITLPFF